MSYALAVNVQLMAEGLADPAFTMVNWDDQAVVATVEQEIVGIITFAWVEWRGEIAIKLGYVDPPCRRCGAYRALWAALVAVAQGKAARKITGVTHADNAAMRAVAARLGRVEHSINLDFDVPQPPARGS